MMARASGAYASLPVPSFRAMRNQANDGGQGSHQDGAQADAAGSDHRLVHGHALLLQAVGELHDQNAVGDHDSHHHDHAHQRHDVQRGAGEHSISSTPVIPVGTASRMRTGSMKERNWATRIKIDRSDAKGTAPNQSCERSAHALHHPPQIHAHIRRVVLLRDDLVDRAGRRLPRSSPWVFT